MARIKKFKQLDLLPSNVKFHGGALLVGRRKSKRPMSFKKPVHLVMRSRKARRAWAFLNPKNKRLIERWLKKFAQRNGLKIYEIALNWDHIHMAVKFPNRRSYNCFIRSFTGTLPKVVFKFQDPNECFWDYRPFTRIIEWGKDFRRTCEYVVRNELEALGLIKYKPRVNRYQKWLADSGALGIPRKKRS